MSASDNDIVSIVMGYFDPHLRRDLECVLMADHSFDVLASALSDVALEEALARRQPQIVILSDMVEYALLARLKARHISTAVVVIACQPSPLAGTMLLAAGITCVAAGAPAADLQAAVRCSTPVASVFVTEDGHWVERYSGSGSRKLTPREMEVFEQLSKGKSYAEVALKLRIGYETVRTHAARICNKLGTKSRLELVGMSLPSEPEQEN